MSLGNSLAHVFPRMPRQTDHTDPPQDESQLDTSLQAIFTQDGVVSLFRTDGNGKIASIMGEPVEDALAAKLDLIWGAGCTGEIDKDMFGVQEAAVLAYEHRLIVIVRLGGGLCVAVATTGSVLGLLFNRLRRLAADAGATP